MECGRRTRGRICEWSGESWDEEGDKSRWLEKGVWGNILGQGLSVLSDKIAFFEVSWSEAYILRMLDILARDVDGCAFV